MNFRKLVSFNIVLNKYNKFLLYGAGETTRKLFMWLELLGKQEKVIAIIDGDNNKHNLIINGKKVISLEVAFSEEFSKYPIMISSIYGREIMEDITDFGSREITDISNFCDDYSQEWVDELTEIYKDKEIYIAHDGKYDIEVNTFKEIFREKLCIKDVVSNFEQVKEPSEKACIFVADRDFKAIENKMLERGMLSNRNFFNLMDLFSPQALIKTSDISANEKSDTTGFCKKDYKGMFCSIPFERLYLYPESAQLCCPWFIDYYSEGNISEVNDLDEVWNSKEAQEHRKTIHEGNYYFCNAARCVKLLNNSLLSANSVDDLYLKKIIDGKSTVIEGGPRFLNLGIAWPCNLYCRMCREKNGENPFKHVDYEHIISVLKAYEFKNLETIYIAGSGEVFANNVYMSILEDIEEYNMPNLKRIIVKTNGQLLHKHLELIEKLSQSYDVELSISLDAVLKETYLLIRRGGDYEQMMKNIDLSRDMRKRGVINRFEITYCIQRLNFRELTEFAKFLCEKEYIDDVILQKVMGENIRDAVHDKRNVYYEEYKDILAKFVSCLKNSSVNLLQEESTAVLD